MTAAPSLTPSTTEGSCCAHNERSTRNRRHPIPGGADWLKGPWSRFSRLAQEPVHKNGSNLTRSRSMSVRPNLVRPCATVPVVPLNQGLNSSKPKARVDRSRETQPTPGRTRQTARDPTAESPSLSTPRRKGIGTHVTEAEQRQRQRQRHDRAPGPPVEPNLRLRCAAGVHERPRVSPRLYSGSVHTYTVACLLTRKPAQSAQPALPRAPRAQVGFF